MPKNNKLGFTSPVSSRDFDVEKPTGSAFVESNADRMQRGGIQLNPLDDNEVTVQSGFGGTGVTGEKWYQDPRGGQIQDPSQHGNMDHYAAMRQHSTRKESHTVADQKDGLAGGDATTTVITSKFDNSVAAINPDLVNLREKEYIKRFAPRSSNGENSKTITFKDLASWNEWARTDPMYTGTMHYVAVVLPGCGAKVEGRCQGAGDVIMEYCNWAKEGPLNTDDYATDPTGANSSAEAPWLLNGAHNPDYRRSCGSPDHSPLIVGSTFQIHFDKTQKLIDKLEDQAEELQSYLTGGNFSGKYTYEPFMEVDGLGSDAGIKSYTQAKAKVLARMQADLAGNDDQFIFYVSFNDSPFQPVDTQYKNSGQTGEQFILDPKNKPLIGVYAAGPVDFQGDLEWKTDDSVWDRTEMAAVDILDCIHKIRLNFEALKTEYVAGPGQKNANNLFFKYENTRFGNWHASSANALIKELTGVGKQKEKFADKLYKDYGKLVKSYNKNIRRLAASVGQNIDLEKYLLPDTRGTSRSAYALPFDINQTSFDTEKHPDDVTEILNLGSKPIIGKVTSDIPGTTIMGVTIIGVTPDACVNNCNTDRFVNASDGSTTGKHSGQGGFPPTTTAAQANNFGAFGPKNGTNRSGTVRGLNMAFNAQAAGSPRATNYDTEKSCMLWPSYAPSVAYDPDQQMKGYSSDGVKQPQPAHFGNNINGNDIRIIENCLLVPQGNAPAINNFVNQRPEASDASGIALHGRLHRPPGFLTRTMSVFMRNNVIVHEFASSAYPVESGMFPSDAVGYYHIPKGHGFNNGQPIHNDVSLELNPIYYPINTLGATYVQSTRTLTASGEWGRHIPSWVKKGSKIMFHTPHACSGVSYTVEQRVSSSGLVLSAASNPGSDVGPAAIFDLRPKLYSGPVDIPAMKTAGYAMSPISIKNMVNQGGQLEVWMQNNTIMAHPDACLEENDTQLGALRRGHSTRVQGMAPNHYQTGGPGTSGYLKSFTPKYIAVANIAMDGCVSNDKGSNTMHGVYTNTSQTGWAESQIFVNMENNLICPVFNARLPVGKTYADDETESSPKWDVVSDIGFPVVNVLGSGCVITHGSVSNNVIVGRTVFDVSKKQYVQHPKDGDNILANMDHTDNSDYPHLVGSGHIGYQWPFASGFKVYDGGPDDVFRSFYGPFYGDNLSDKHLSVTGKGDSMDSFTRQRSFELQFSLNKDVLIEGCNTTVVHNTFAGIPKEIHGFGAEPSFDFAKASLVSSSRVDVTKSIPTSVVRPKLKTMSEPDSLSFGEKSIVDSKTGENLTSTTQASIGRPRHVGACAPPLSSQQGEKRTLPNTAANINILCTVGQKKSNIKNGVFVNIDNGINPAGSLPQVYGDIIKNDVIEYPNQFMPVTQGGMRVLSGGKNDRPVVGFNDYDDIEIHLGQTRDNVEENDKASSNIDKLYNRFKSQNGDGIQQ